MADSIQSLLRGFFTVIGACVSIALFLLLVGIVTRILARIRGRIAYAMGHTRPRDVASTADATLGNSVTEAPLPAGSPLREHARRLVRHDKRLLPKLSTPREVFSRAGKRVRLFPRAEAARLFSASFRTTNRNLRALAEDTDQLARFGLPVWRSEEELASALGITIRSLRSLATHRIRERRPHYYTFSLPKADGSRRIIMAPKRRLKAAQRRLLELLAGRLPVHPAAHGFVTGRSVVTNAREHLGARVMLNIDLRNFFPSVTFGRLRGYLIAVGYSYPVATSIALLATECVRQPVLADGVLYHAPAGPRHCVQGAPTSPLFCNAIVQRMDRRLAGLARKRGFRYTRYADDITFSSATDRATDEVAELYTTAHRIVRLEGFRLNHAKTRIARTGSAMRVTGVTINSGTTTLSRKERRRIRAAIHRAATSGATAAQWRRIDGMVAYVGMIHPAHGQALAERRRASGG